jgi:hypothetical protein
MEMIVHDEHAATINSLNATALEKGPTLMTCPQTRMIER